jgi:hypothetical protein
VKDATVFIRMGARMGWIRRLWCWLFHGPEVRDYTPSGIEGWSDAEGQHVRSPLRQLVCAQCGPHWVRRV